MSSKLRLGDLPFDDDLNDDFMEDGQYQRQKPKTTKTKKRKSDIEDYGAQRAQKRQSSDYLEFR